MSQPPEYYKVLKLSEEGKTVKEISQLTGYCPRQITRIRNKMGYHGYNATSISPVQPSPQVQSAPTPVQPTPVNNNPVFTVEEATNLIRNLIATNNLKRGDLGEILKFAVKLEMLKSDGNEPSVPAEFAQFLANIQPIIPDHPENAEA